MGYMSASNVAALHAALKIKPSESVRRRYLHPLREVDPTLRIFQSWFRDDCQILMIGPDTLLLKERIRNPEAYYQHYRGRVCPQLEAWVRLKRMKRLKRKWNNRRNAMVDRAAALVALEDILDLDTLRQCLCLYDHNQPDSNTLDVDTLVGESILVKSFDIFDCNDMSSSGLVRLRFLEMQFRLPWNINKAISPGDRWTPKDGMPYIDTAYPFCPQFATADRTCPRGSPRKNFGERDAALLFDYDYSLDERWTVSIPTNVFRDGLF
ncbi:hypothetical protein BDV12DRAFT_191158 [Aspergillus spectabilis]